MKSDAATPDAFFDQLPDDRKPAMSRLRAVLNAHLPAGFEERVSYGMASWVVPHSSYPAGYHCDPKQPLPFISLASQKNFIALYHMGLYSDPALLEWFTAAYPEHSKTKLDMGKSCIRFKKPEAVPFELIAELAGKMSPQQWIGRYESVLKRQA